MTDSFTFFLAFSRAAAFHTSLLYLHLNTESLNYSQSLPHNHQLNISSARLWRACSFFLRPSVVNYPFFCARRAADGHKTNIYWARLWRALISSIYIYISINLSCQRQMFRSGPLKGGLQEKIYFLLGCVRFASGKYDLIDR